MEQISLRVPATCANLGPGFDTFGLALKLYNRFTFDLAKHDALMIAPATCVEVTDLPGKIEDNLLFRAVDRFYQHVERPRPPMSITLEGHVPFARGLGSSSTAIVAGLKAANMFCEEPLDNAQMLALAVEIEGHPDNVAPALMGGAVLCDEGKAYSLAWPPEWKMLAVVPSYQVSTEKARKALPEQVAMSDAVFNVRKSSLLTYALLKSDADALREALHDRLHQPYRQQLIPEFEHVVKLAKEFNTLGCIISGSGSTMAIFCTDEEGPQLLEAFQKHSVKVPNAALLKAFLLDIDHKGAHVT